MKSPLVYLPSGLESLPNELLQKILASCSTRELYRMALTNKRLSSPAYLLLYRDVPELNTYDAIAFLASICFYEQLGPLVRALHLNLRGGCITKTLPKVLIPKRPSRLRFLDVIMRRRVLDDIFSLLTTALKNLPNLLELQLYLQERESNDFMCDAVLGGKYTFQLKSFKTSFEFGPALGAFLRKQNNLVDFHFDTARLVAPQDILTAPDGCVPKLTTLGWSRRTPLSLVKQLVEDRPVENISIFLDRMTVNIARLLDIGEVSMRIKSAWFTYALAPTAEHLTAIATQFPNLVILRLDVPVITENTVKTLTPSFARFMSLEQMTVAGCDEFIPHFPHNLPPAFRNWLKVCPTLQYIVVPRYGLSVVRKSWYRMADPFVGKQLMQATYGK